MLNLRNPLGRRIQVTTTADVSSGALILDGQILGIPVEHKLSGATVTFIQEGLVNLTFSLQGTIGAGSYLYWDVSASLLSLGAGAADLEVGQVLGPDPDGVGNVYLTRLNLGAPRAAAGNDQSSIAS